MFCSEEKQQKTPTKTTKGHKKKQSFRKTALLP